MMLFILGLFIGVLIGVFGVCLIIAGGNSENNYKNKRIFGESVKYRG